MDECCTMTCDAISCQDGFVKKDMESSSLLKVSHATCCERTCDTYNCSAAFVKKSGVEGLKQFSDEACCVATCATYDCPDGYNLVSSSGSILKLSTETCCEKSCNLFTCPKGFLPLHNSSVSGFSRMLRADMYGCHLQPRMPVRVPNRHEAEARCRQHPGKFGCAVLRRDM